MATKTDELLKEFAHRWGWKFTPKNEGDEWECHPKEIISDLRTLIDKLMPTENEIEAEADNHSSFIGIGGKRNNNIAKQVSFMQGARWFRNRMKGGE